MPGAALGDAGRQIPGHKSVGLSFEDDRTPLTEEQVRTETSRCLRCGISHVDENMCIGCGVCTTRCDFYAIHLRRVFDGHPVIREKLVPSVLGEIGRRMVWTKAHDHQPRVTKVGGFFDPNVSYATGAVYHKPDANAAEEKRAFAKEKAADAIAKRQEANRHAKDRRAMVKHEKKLRG